MSERHPAYVLDATSLIHFERSKDLGRLPAAEVKLFIPDRVAREVNKPRYPLRRWLEENFRLVTKMLPEESRSYLKFRIQPETKLDDGEAAALAIALQRSAQLVTDDGAAQRKATSHGVPWLDTGNFVRQAIPRQLRLTDC